MTNTGYNKQSVHANVTQQLNSALSANLNIMWAHSLTRRGVTGNENDGVSPIDVMSATPQFYNLDHRNPDGSWATNPFAVANMFADAVEIQTPEDVQRFIGGGNIGWAPFSTEHQSLHFRFICELPTSPRSMINSPDAAGPAGHAGRRERTGRRYATVQNDLTQFINYSVNAVHHYAPSAALDATTSIGFVRERRTNNAPDIVAQNLISGVNSPTAGTVTTVFFNRDAAYDQSLYAQEQVLLLDQRLALGAGVTAERTTNDGDINKFYMYPHYSASYRVPQFVGFLDELKFRAAYGQSGTEPNYGVKYTPDTSGLISGQSAVYPAVLHGSQGIRPEAETEIETGFDATFLKSRAQFTFTVYQKRIQDLLLQAGVAPALGYNTVWFNGGEFTNQGIELSLSATPLQFRNGFTWNTTETFYRNYSVVNSLPIPPFIVGSTFGGIFGQFGYLAPGRSVSEMAAPGILTANGSPTQVGDFQPAYIVSVSQEFTWNHFRLYGLLDWHRGADVINTSNLLFDFGGTLEDTTASQKRLASWLGGSVYPYMEPASFIKLREVTLSYTVPRSFTNFISRGGLNFTNARLSFTGRNLWMSFRYTGLDPEVSSFGNQQVTTATDTFAYPPSRSFFLSLDLGF